MRLFVGVTDRAWFEHLRRIPDLDEVNFWQPSRPHQIRVITEEHPPASLLKTRCWGLGHAEWRGRSRFELECHRRQSPTNFSRSVPR